jgi:hypothetical protein
MRSPLLLVALALLLIPLGAQRSPQPGTVRGQVRLADTGAPATGAKIELELPLQPGPPPPIGREYISYPHDPPNLYATVDDAGSFVIPNVPPGDYTVFTNYKGYTNQDARMVIGMPSPPIKIQALHVSPGQTNSVSLQLERGGSIQGSVIFAASDNSPQHPAQDVGVSLEIEARPGIYRRYGPSADTDAEGHFILDTLPPGRYKLFAASGGNVLLYAPSTVRPSAAQPVEVTQNKTTTAPAIEIPSRVFTVTGRVQDTEGNPITTGDIQLYPTGEPGIFRGTRVDEHGTFTFKDVPEERYTAAISFPPTQKFLGMTDNNTGFRMLLQPSPFQPASADVLVSSQNPTPVTLTVKSSSTAH